MIRTLFALTAALASTPALACVTSNVGALTQSAPFAELTAGAEWEIIRRGEYVEGYCPECGDERSFMLSVNAIGPLDLTTIAAFLEEQHALFCDDVVQANAGACLDGQMAPLGDAPGYVGMAQVDGGMLYTDRVVCDGFALVGQINAQTDSAEFQKLITDLRAAMAFLVQAD